MLRLGFDAKRVFTNFTGLGNYSRTLLRNLSYYYPDFAYFLYTPAVVRNSETKNFLNSPLFSVHYPSRIERPFWRNYRLQRMTRKHKIDLFHGLANELPTALQGTPCCKVVTIHDLAYKRQPEFLSFPQRMLTERRVNYAIRHADHLVVPSHSTKADIMDYFNVTEDNISVIYQSCNERFLQEKSEALLEDIRARYRLPEQYLLYVGALTARKNLLAILEMMRELPPTYDLPLVVVGHGRRYYKRVQRFLQTHRLSNRVQFIAPDFDDLPGIFQRAAVFVYPSLYEGFGIPVLEALYSKTPVVTSNRSSLPEVAGPGALLVDPEDTTALSQAVQRFLDDDAYREEMVDKGYAFAQQFRGEPVSEQMVDLYRNLLGADDLEGPEW